MGAVVHTKTAIAAGGTGFSRFHYFFGNIL
jgi:hypothetical protein